MAAIPGLSRLPLREQRADDHRLDNPHDLVAVGVVRPELRALVRVEAALEQRAEDRRVDLRPVERRRLERRLDPLIGRAATPCRRRTDRR